MNAKNMAQRKQKVVEVLGHILGRVTDFWRWDGTRWVLRPENWVMGDDGKLKPKQIS